MAGEKDKAKGSIKEGVGKLTGDHEMQSEGKADKAKGHAKDAAHEAKEGFKRGLKDDKR